MNENSPCFRFDQPNPALDASRTRTSFHGIRRVSLSLTIHWGRRMTSHNMVKPYSCRCRNISINAYDITPSTEPNDNYEQAFVGEDGVQIVRLPSLSL